MDYLEWNRVLGEHFFPSVKTDGSSNYLCVTGQLLADLGGFTDPDLAIRDFIDAILKGPKWTQIERCSTVLSKAHNCLNPDPKWEKRKVFFGRKIEKIELVGHIHWKNFKDYSDYHPPYLAYLCLFILAFTERHDEDFALNYYNPLARLLGTQENIPLGKRYFCDGKENTINTIWRDLEEWVSEKGITGFKLPPEKQEDYIYIPLYFGLLKARDLRNLDSLFSLLEQNKILDPDNVPPAIQFVEMLSSLPELPKYFSNEGVQAVRDNDLTKKRALGSLLYARYLAWDGNPEEKTAGSSPSYFRGVMLLRYLTLGSLLSVVKIRSQNLLEKLPIEADREYKLKSHQGNAAVWPGGSSLWFQPLKITPPDPFKEFVVEFEEIPIKAKMAALEYIVMENHELPFHLQDQNGFIEVERRKGLEPGRRYLLLSQSKEKPKIEKINLIPFHGLLLPEALTAWWLNIPLNPEREKWPSSIPPLADMPVQTRPSIRLESFVRVQPRVAQFLKGYPLSVAATQSEYEPFIKTKSRDIEYKMEQSDDKWSLICHEPCAFTISLRDKNDMKEVVGSEVSVEFLDPETVFPQQESALLKDLKNTEGVSRTPPYPQASISLSGAKQVGVRNDGVAIFFCDDRPKINLQTTDPSSVRLFIDGNLTANGGKPWSTEGTHSAQARYKNNEILESISFELIKNKPECKVKVENISNSQSNPTKFSETHKIFLKANYLVPLKIQYLIKDKQYKRTYSLKMLQQAEIILSEKTPLRRWHIYEIEFFHCSRSIFTGWFQWTPSPGSLPAAPKTITQKGLLRLSSIFEIMRKKTSE